VAANKSRKSVRRKNRGKTLRVGSRLDFYAVVSREGRAGGGEGSRKPWGGATATDSRGRLVKIEREGKER